MCMAGCGYDFWDGGLWGLVMARRHRAATALTVGLCVARASARGRVAVVVALTAVNYAGIREVRLAHPADRRR